MNSPTDGPQEGTFSDEILAEYAFTIRTLLDNQLGISAPMNAILTRILSMEGVTFLGATFGAVAYSIARDYRDARGREEDSDLFVQEELPCWEKSREVYPPFYSQSLQFINSAINDDGEAAVAVWTAVITTETEIEDDLKLFTRVVGDLQHFIDHIDDPTCT